ncbi:hypothetical protein GOA59_27505, partial [Sinorhizobium meliloti]|nr:hypothetical protein [Sinorhizobium meliloti]MDW9608591.1 hypothetical protein [Sinorhizobium meliloti]MDW9676475.1 hypothetical protein [Sinorhizobium meliloti]MDW9955333.1 hypothetical protein [Sinorhizobium meliloti]MDX0390028.1 hypothetical protein [Sinorhizobium meliloti]
RGRLFLGIGGRDHFGIRGRIASEFALVARVKANLNRNAVTLGWLRSPWREGLLIAVSKREIFEQCWLASAMPDRSMFPIDDPVTWRRISN